MLTSALRCVAALEQLATVKAQRLRISCGYHTAGSPAAAGVWGGSVPRPWGPAAKAPAAAGELPSASSPWSVAAAAGGGGGATGSSATPRPPPSDHPLLRPVTKEDMGERSGAGTKKKSKPVLLFSSAQRRY